MIVPVVGDLIADKLGLSIEDRSMIMNECEVVINSAASVNFNDPLKDTLDINYGGSSKMLDLCKEC